MKKFLLIPVMIIVALSQNVFASVGFTAPLSIESVSAIGVAFGGHKAGNMEIKVLNGFTLPSGVSCDTNYITTKKADDPDRAMFKLLEDASASNRQVQLWISDIPSHNAYPGRCSIYAVTVLPE